MSNVSTSAHTPAQPRRVVVQVAGGQVGAQPRVHPADQPLLLANDLGVVRGDGCFETLLLLPTGPAKPERHLARLARSAQALGISGPTEEQWTAAMALAATEWAAGNPAKGGHTGGGVAKPSEAKPSEAKPGDTTSGAATPSETKRGEAMLRLALTRGPEHGGGPTAYVAVSEIPAAVQRARTEGMSLGTLTRGYSVDLAEQAPWLLLGSKTLSYAVNMAALRYAQEQGYDDALFLSAEGDVLEGPRSTLVIARNGELLSPPASTGILDGTTLAALAEVAEKRSIPLKRERLILTDLIAADGVWMVSSVTLASRVHTIDGTELPRDDAGLDVAALIDEAVGRKGAVVPE